MHFPGAPDAMVQTVESAIGWQAPPEHWEQAGQLMPAHKSHMPPAHFPGIEPSLQSAPSATGWQVPDTH